MFLNFFNLNFSFEVVKFVYDKFLDMKGIIKYVLFIFFMYVYCIVYIYLY